MKKKAVFLFSISALFLCGCSTSFENEYLSVTDYDATAYTAPAPEIISISSYAELNSVLNGMIENRQETADFQFNSYEGNVSDDLAEACFQVKSNTAIGSYMIDYISYDINRIVSYYNATVYVNYMHSLEELSSIDTISTNLIDESVIEAVSEKQKNLTLEVYTSVIDGAVMDGKVKSAVLNAPAKIPVVPDVTVEFFADSNLNHIFDITFNYAYEDEIIDQMSSELTEKIRVLASEIPSDNQYNTAISTIRKILEICEYDSTAPKGSAYDSLVGLYGDSRAIAMGYSALCEAKGIESIVVSGFFNDNEHYWNLVKVNDLWYHIDITEISNRAPSDITLNNDEEMFKNYRWDTVMYPSSSDVPLFAPFEPAGNLNPSEELTEDALTGESEAFSGNLENIE